VRCDECKVEPVTPNHFCECCGRKLSLQERKPLDERKAAAAETSWGEPAPVLRKAPKGDRLVGIHFTPEPEPYVDEPRDEPAPVVDRVDVDTHVRDFDAAWPEPTVAPAAPATIDPILEAHFAGHAPVEAAPDSHVPAPPAAPVGEPQISAAAPAVHLDSDVPVARCESCGGPVEVGDLCSRCHQAFHSLLDAQPASELIAVAAPPAPPAGAPHEVVPVVSAVPAEPEAAPVVSPVPAEPAQTVIAVRAPVAPVAPVVPIVEVAPAPEAPPQPSAAAPSLPISKPAPVAVAAVASSQDQPSRVRTIGGVIAVLVAVAAIGFPLSKLWFGGQGTAAFIRQDEPKFPVQQAVASPDEDAVAPAAVATSSAAVTSASATVQAALKVPAAKVPPVAPKVSPAVASRTAAKVPPKSAKPNGSMRLASPVTAPAPVAAAPAPEVAPPAPVAAPEPKPEAPAAPIGQFFETRDVNEAPKIATKVEPQVPDDLRDRPLNEIVIVRVLVTQTGHAHMVNLLRRSKAGPSLDDAIVAAVKQWTFVPARKRGEAVSCWYHVGVPVNRAN
jgi:protein TonB